MTARAKGAEAPFVAWGLDLGVARLEGASGYAFQGIEKAIVDADGKA